MPILVLNFPGNISRGIPDLAVKNRLPAIYYNSSFVVDRGGLMSYGASITDLDRRAAIYVDKILKGAKAADLPVEQPTKFELVYQSESCQANRPDDSAKCAGAGGQGDSLGMRPFDAAQDRQAPAKGVRNMILS